MYYDLAHNITGHRPLLSNLIVQLNRRALRKHVGTRLLSTLETADLDPTTRDKTIIPIAITKAVPLRCSH